MRFVIPVVIVFAVALFAVMAGQNDATNPSSTETAMVQMDSNGVVTPAMIEPAAGNEEAVAVNPESAEMLQKAIAKMAPESSQPIVLQQSPSAE